MNLDLPQEVQAAEQRSWPQVDQSPNNHDLTHEETTQVLMMLLEAMKLRVKRTQDDWGNRTLLLEQAD